MMFKKYFITFLVAFICTAISLNFSNHSYATGTETQHVVYADGSGDIHELFAGDSWQHNNLTQAASAPPAWNAYGYATGNVQHVIYTGKDFHIHELFAGNTWQHNDISALAQAPTGFGSPTAYTTGGGQVEHVVYVASTDNHIHELFAGNTWQHNDISALAQAPEAFGDYQSTNSRPFGYTTLDGQEVQHVVYRANDSHIHELFAGDRWRHNNISALAQAPTSSGYPTAYTTNSKQIQHVVYCGVDHHIHELFSGSTWQHNDISTLAQAPDCSGGFFPVGYVTEWEGQEIQHVVYKSLDNHIHELFAGNTWQHNDLTVLGQVPDCFGEVAAYTTDERRIQHIVFGGRDRNIYELFAGDEWKSTNLTAATGQLLNGSQYHLHTYVTR